VARIDNTWGDRNLVCACPNVEKYEQGRINPFFEPPPALRGVRRASPRASSNSSSTFGGNCPRFLHQWRGGSVRDSDSPIARRAR
jgi:hypothetical protein